MPLVPVRLSAVLAALMLAMPAGAQQQAAPAKSAPPPAEDAPSPETVPELPAIEPDAPMVPLPETIATDAAAAPATSERVPSLHYRTEVTGLTSDQSGEFKALSELEKNDEIESLAQLDRRAHDDAGLIDRLLRARGYYSSQIDVSVDRPDGNEGRALVKIKVEPGPLYTLSSVTVVTPRSAPRPLVMKLFDLKAGAAVDTRAIQAAEARLSTGLPEYGYPFALVGERDVVIDHANHTASYKVGVTTGAQARIREIRIEGPRKLIGRKQTARLVRTRPGELYDARDLEDFRRVLVSTGLYGSVAVRAVPVPDAPDGAAQVDIVATTEPAPLHTIAGQLGYSTGEGLRLEGSWQDRRFVEPEGALTLRGVAGTREQRAASELRFSNWRARDRTLLLRTEASHINQDAYQAKTLTLGASLARETNLIWQKKWFWSLGAELLFSNETDTDLTRGITRNRNYGIAALPSSINYDGTDSLLDPRRGFRLSLRGSPEASLQNGAFGYFKAQIDGSAYQPISDGIVAAGRVRVGSILGASRERIAPSRRFYAGGGGSIRGFGYQDIGPKDPFGDPIGGRSLTEVAAELRFKVVGDFGIVPFVDAGQLYTSPMPKFSGFRYGGGIGIRYYSSFGPIRFDVARAIDYKAGDPKFTVYVSIGQAF